MTSKIAVKEDGTFAIYETDPQRVRYFTTRLEAEAVMNKIMFAEAVQEMTTVLAQIADYAVDIEEIYFDVGYDAGGSDPIVDDDVETLGLTAALVASMITLMQQFNKFASNQAVTTADYKTTMNQCRTRIKS